MFLCLHEGSFGVIVKFVVLVVNRYYLLFEFGYCFFEAYLSRRIYVQGADLQQRIVEMEEAETETCSQDLCGAAKTVSRTSLAISRESQTMLDPKTYDMAPRSSSSYPTYHMYHTMTRQQNVLHIRAKQRGGRVQSGFKACTTPDTFKKNREGG